jgi:hypothetical protein
MEMEIDWYEGREGCLRLDLVIEQAKLFTDCRKALSQCDNSLEGKIGLYGFRVGLFAAWKLHQRMSRFRA